MKRIYLALLLLSGLFVSAQTQAKNEKICKNLQRTVDSLVKVNEQDKAFNVWLELRKTCPSANDRVYTSGVDLYRYRIQRAKPEDKEATVSELLKLYDDYNKNIPSNNEPVLMYKAMAMDKYKAGTDAEMYDLLDRGFAKNPTKFTDTQAVYLYLKLYFDKYKAGDKTITPNKILRKRDDLIAHVEKLTAADASRAKSNDRVILSMRVLVKEVSTCENLDAYYGEVFEKRKTDTLWLAVALDALSDNNCRSSKMFKAITELQQSTKPTAQSAYNLGSEAYQKADFDKAAKYFVQSAELSKDAIEKADTYFTLASTIYVGRDKARQKEYAMKALQAKPDYAKSYILLAQLYADASADCGKNEFEKKALNWLAAETIKKAIAVNKNMGSLDKLLHQYEAKAPNAKEIKQAKMGGMTVHYDCWINESVIVPNAK